MIALPPDMKNFIKRVIIDSNVFNTLHGYVSRIVILRYHSIKEKPFYYDKYISGGIIHSKDIFYEQMEILARHYNPISLDDLVNILSGKQNIPKRAVLVTFDDGYTDNLEIAAPILNQLGIPGGFYITVNAIGNSLPPWYIRLRYGMWSTSEPQWKNPSDGLIFSLNSINDRMKAFIASCHSCALLGCGDQNEFVNSVIASLEVDEANAYKDLMLTWNQVRELVNMGHIVGSHTLSHPNLAFLTTPEAEEEICESKKIMEEQLPIEVKHFSYPNPALTPNCNSSLAESIQKAGYMTAVTSNPGYVKCTDNPFLLQRIGVPDYKNEFLWCLDLAYLC